MSLDVLIDFLSGLFPLELIDVLTATSPKAR
jgi:hypothetical protein